MPTQRIPLPGRTHRGIATADIASSETGPKLPGWSLANHTVRAAGMHANSALTMAAVGAAGRPLILVPIYVGFLVLSDLVRLGLGRLFQLGVPATAALVFSGASHKGSFAGRGLKVQSSPNGQRRTAQSGAGVCVDSGRDSRTSGPPELAGWPRGCDDH